MQSVVMMGVFMFIVILLSVFILSAIILNDFFVGAMPIKTTTQNIKALGINVKNS
jgi:hypothetical protein